MLPERTRRSAKAKVPSRQHVLCWIGNEPTQSWPGLRLFLDILIEFMFCSAVVLEVGIGGSSPLLEPFEECDETADNDAGRGGETQNSGRLPIPATYVARSYVGLLRSVVAETSREVSFRFVSKKKRIFASTKANHETLQRCAISCLPDRSHRSLPSLS